MSPRSSSALLLATATAWDVHTPTNRTCLGGCGCVPRLRACVPTAPSKDMKVFAQSLASLAARGVDLEAIYVVSRASPDVDQVIAKANAARARGRRVDFVRWLDEEGGFPFSYASVKAALEAAGATHGGSYAYAVGWYLQQLIKLYCGRAIDRAERSVAGPWNAADVARAPDFDALVVDSDVVWLRDVAFVHAAARDAAGACRATYNAAFSREAHGLYYVTNKNLLGAADGAPVPDAGGHPVSGVAHHMVFRSDVVAAIEARVSKRLGAPLHAALLKPEAGVVKEAHRNAFSEYQLYFHFARRVFPGAVRVRQLYWANGPGPRSVAICGGDGWPAHEMRGLRAPTEAVDADRTAGYDYVAYHSYAKRRPCVYGPAADRADGGACFGGGCTRDCYKSRADARFKARSRERVAPRLCVGEG